MEKVEFKTIKLEQPKKTGGMSLFEALSKRKSARDFDANKFLSLSQLSQLLWCVYGTNREGGFKVVPSAVHMNPLSIYVFMKSGTFKYSPETLELLPVKEGDNRALCGTQDFVKNASLNLVIVTNYKVKSPLGIEMDEKARYQCSLLDSGHCCQNAYLYCASEGLKCVERGSCDREKLSQFLGLNKDTQVMITLSIGY